MKHVPQAIATLLTAVAISVLAAPVALAQLGVEAIRSYDVRIEVRTDDSLRITETIVYDFGGRTATASSATCRRGLRSTTDTTGSFPSMWSR
jgi:hypothetical protein